MNKIENILDNFIDLPEEELVKKKKRVIKNDKTILERENRVFIIEDGRRLLKG